MNIVHLRFKQRTLSSKLIVSILNTYANFNINKENIRKGRQRFDRICSKGPKPKINTVKNYEIQSIPVREYFQDVDRPYLVFFHGGGYVLGSLKSHDTLCRRISKYCKLNVISVDYSLAPEAKFPVQLNEGRTVVNAIIQTHGPEIYLGGDSAGGNLAAVLSSEYRNLKGQMLLYPLVNANLTNPTINSIGTSKNFLTAEMLHWFRSQYTSDGSDFDNPLLSPYKLKNSTPTFIAVGTRDCLLDDCRQYANALSNQNTECTLVIASDALHGFMQQPHRFGYRQILNEFNQFTAHHQQISREQ